MEASSLIGVNLMMTGSTEGHLLILTDGETQRNLLLACLYQQARHVKWKSGHWNHLSGDHFVHFLIW